jgi:hypothetical protein
MPIPKVICSICGEEVNKAQTLHIGGGKRACKSHEGTLEASRAELEKARQKKQTEAEAAKKKKEKKEAVEAPPDFQPECMICRCKGLRQEDWYTRLIIEMKKHEITHGNPIHMFSPDIQKINALVGVSCLYYVIWRGSNTKIKIPYRTYQAVLTQQSLGFDEPVLLICQDCVLKKKFTTYAQERMVELMENDLFLQAVAGLSKIMSPEFKKIAIREIAESN